MTNIDHEDTIERFGTRQPNQASLNAHAQVRARFAELDEFLQTLPAGRVLNRARTELESAAMWANKAASRLSPNPSELRTRGY